MGILFSTLPSGQCFKKQLKRESRIAKEKFTWLKNLTSGEVKELLKPFIHNRPEYFIANAMRLLEKQYGNPHKLLACYM